VSIQTPGAARPQTGVKPELVALRDVVGVRYGKAKPAGTGPIPVIGSGGTYGTTSAPLTGPGSIVIGRKGSAGSVWWPGVACWPSDTTFYLEPDTSRIDPAFLYYWLIEHPLSGEHAQTTMPSLQKPDIERLRIPLPPLKEQHRFIRILSTIQRARDAVSSELRRALDLKLTMVRDGFQLEGHPIVSCGDVCDVLSVGIVVRPTQYYTSDGVLALRSQNVREDELDLRDVVRINRVAHNGQVAKSALRPGDVVIVRTGYPGTSAVIPADLTEVNCIDLVFARPSRLVHAEYLSRFFNSPSGRRQALAAKTGLAQQHLNVGAVARTQLPLPPLDVQRAIVERLQSMDRLIKAIRNELRCSDALFAATLRRTMGSGA
jgi:type I restriction enzyme S subunit